MHVDKGSFMLVRTVTAKYRKHKGGEKTYANRVHCQTERVMSESVPTTNLVYIYVHNIYNKHNLQ